MKGSLIALSLTSSVAAQIMTFPHEAAIVAALDPSDPQYTACEAANDLLNECVSSAGGTDALQTADPTALLNCACCDSGSAISNSFSVCSTYLKSEAGIGYTSQASAYGTLYSLCSINANCKAGGGGGGSGLSSPKTQAASTTPAATGSAAGSTITGGAAVTSYPDACVDLVGIITSCQSKTDGFTDLGFRDQASCYCCKRNPQGTSTFNDAFDGFASTCAVWAKSGDPSTAYPIASRFETLCEQFSDVCKASATITSSGSKTTGSSGGSGGSGGSSGGSSGANAGDVTVTVTPTTSSKSGATGLRVAAGALVGAFAAMIIAF